MSGQSQSKFVALERQIASLIQEVELHKSLLTQQENKIKQCLDEKLQLQKQLEQQEQKYRLELLDKDRIIREIHKTFEQKTEVLNTQELKQKLQLEYSDKERSALKEELHKISLAKYEVERRCVELEAQFQMRTTGKEEETKELIHLREQIPQLEQMVNSQKQEAKHLAIAVKEVMELCLEVDSVSRHSACIVREAIEKRDLMAQQLVQARTELSTGIAEENTEHIDGKQLQQTFAEIKAEREKLSAQIKDFEVGSSKEMVAKNAAWKEVNELRSELIPLRKEMESVREELSIRQRELYEQRKLHATTVAEFQFKEQKLVTENAKLKRELEMSENECQRVSLDLRQSNDTEALCQDRIFQLEAENDKLRAGMK